MDEKKKNNLIYDALHCYFMIYRFGWATSSDKELLQTDEWRSKLDDIDELLAYYGDLVF